MVTGLRNTVPNVEPLAAGAAAKAGIQPGDIVLSPFAGIGSEGYVALQMRRRFVGIELKASYYQQAARNLKAALQGTGDLFYQDAAEEPA